MNRFKSASINTALLKKTTRINCSLDSMSDIVIFTNKFVVIYHIFHLLVNVY